MCMCERERFPCVRNCRYVWSSEDNAGWRSSSSFLLVGRSDLGLDKPLPDLKSAELRHRKSITLAATGDSPSRTPAPGGWSWRRQRCWPSRCTQQCLWGQQIDMGHMLASIHSASSLARGPEQCWKEIHPVPGVGKGSTSSRG